MPNHFIFLFILASLTVKDTLTEEDMFLIFDLCKEPDVFANLSDITEKQIKFDPQVSKKLQEKYKLPTQLPQSLAFEDKKDKLNFLFPLLQRTTAALGQQDVYLFIINSIRNYTQQRPDEQDLPTELHHIIPKHTKKPEVNHPDNLIRLFVGHHALVHWVRWKQENSPYDFLAYLLKSKQTADVTAERIKTAQATMKQENKGFYNSDLQRDLGQRGGQKGGKANTPAQQAARSEVGKTYGRSTGMQNCSPVMKEFLLGFCCWKYVGWLDQNGEAHSFGKLAPDERAITLFILTGPVEAFIDLKPIFNTFVPGTNKIFSHLYQLVEGRRKMRDGFSIERMLTRSEVEAGELNKLPPFYTLADLSAHNVNPDQILGRD